MTDESIGDTGEEVADSTRRAIRDHPWLETLGRLGWIAKGVVYLLMGVTATQIARRQSSDDEASPSGALDRVMEQPGGRVLLLVMGVGLVLYAVWRACSVAVIRAGDLSAWVHRAGYACSAAFYALLALTAFRIVARDAESGRDNTVESLSRSLMGSPPGRALVVAGGALTIGVGLYFVIRKAILRSFVDDLHRIDESDDEAVDWTIIVAGIAGWIGRGVVTVLVGVFVARAAIQFDPDDARGFDGALREVATTSFGTLLVWGSAVGLMLYGVFCLLGHRYRRIEDDS